MPPEPIISIDLKSLEAALKPGMNRIVGIEN
jgi:hypothetical protein